MYIAAKACCFENRAMETKYVFDIERFRVNLFNVQKLLTALDTLVRSVEAVGGAVAHFPPLDALTVAAEESVAALCCRIQHHRVQVGGSVHCGIGR